MESLMLDTLEGQFVDIEKNVIVIENDGSADEPSACVYIVPREKYKEEVGDKFSKGEIKVVSQYWGGEPIVVLVDYCSG
jgi:hypothetical protein